MPVDERIAFRLVGQSGVHLTEIDGRTLRQDLTDILEAYRSLCVLVDFLVDRYPWPPDPLA